MTNDFSLDDRFSKIPFGSYSSNSKLTENYVCTKPDTEIPQLLYEKFHFWKIEEKIGYKFIDKSKLVAAFTHYSFGCSISKLETYQIFEFLGDAILDLIILIKFFEKHFDHLDCLNLINYK